MPDMAISSCARRCCKHHAAQRRQRDPLPLATTMLGEIIRLGHVVFDIRRRVYIGISPPIHAHTSLDTLYAHALAIASRVDRQKLVWLELVESSSVSSFILSPPTLVRVQPTLPDSMCRSLSPCLQVYGFSV